jgi:two-component system, cell cycle sensor histidine kinase and response regulator CckA
LNNWTKILDLNSIVTDAQKLFYRIIGEAINLNLSMDSELKKIKADAGQIDQIIMNLVVNARDAMPNGGILSIKTGNLFLTPNNLYEHPDGIPGQFVFPEVADSGIGI